MEEITEAHFDKLFNVNVKGLLFTVQKAVALFQDGGTIIILMASIGGSKGVEGLSVYHSTKAAIRSFARSWTVDLKQRKIRINCISPGPIDTPGLRHALHSVQDPGKLMTTYLNTYLWEDLAILMISPVPSLSLHRMTAVLSRVSNSA